MDDSDLNAEALLTAQADQRQSELKTLAALLGAYRSGLLEAGFSEEQMFALISRLYLRANLTLDTPLFTRPTIDWDDDEE